MCRFLTVSARALPFTYNERDGYRDNGPLVADGDDLDDIGVRGHLLWDIGESTSLLLSADYYEHQGVGPVGAQVECPDSGCNIPIPPDPAGTNPLNTEGYRDNTDTNFKLQLDHSFPVCRPDLHRFLPGS